MKDYNDFFDNNYKLYDKVRPEYPNALYDDILTYKPLVKSSRVFEIGIGTGKATVKFNTTLSYFSDYEEDDPNAPYKEKSADLPF